MKKLTRSSQTPIHFASLTTAFLSTIRLGEFTVRSLTAYDPKSHVKRAGVGENVNRRGLRTTTFRILETKANHTEDETPDRWPFPAWPNTESPLRGHLEVNNLANGFHLFRDRNKQDGTDDQVDLYEMTSRRRVSCRTLPRMKGHLIRISSTLEYLLHRLPFDVMNRKGR